MWGEVVASRSNLQQEVVSALLDTNAINFEAVGSVLGKFGARLAREGDAFYFVVHRNVIDGCIPPYQLVGDLVRGELEGAIAARATEELG